MDFVYDLYNSSIKFHYIMIVFLCLFAIHSAKKQPLKDIYIIILNDMGLHPTAQARDVESDQTLGLTA